MSLSIRLARAGARKRPFYRVVVADSRMPRDGRFIEKIGVYDPLLTEKGQRVSLQTERAQHWIARGAKPSRRVALFLAAAGAGEKPSVPTQTKKSLPRKKELERRAQAQQAEAKTKDAPPAAPQAEADKPVAEKPVADKPVAENNEESTEKTADEKPQENT